MHDTTTNPSATPSAATVRIEHRPAGPVLVKEVGAADAEALTEEGRILDLVRHPGVVDLLEIETGPTGGRLVTGFVGSHTLETWVPAGSEHVAGFFAALAETVADLHLIGLAHGRLTADHVLLDRDGRPRLCGFRGAVVVDGSAPTARHDDVLALGLLLDLVLDRLDAAAPRRGWRMGRRAGRALRTVAALAQRTAGPDRPSARRLAGAILDAVPTAHVIPASAPLAGLAELRERDSSSTADRRSRARPTMSPPTSRPPATAHHGAPALRPPGVVADPFDPAPWTASASPAPPSPLLGHAPPPVASWAEPPSTSSGRPAVGHPAVAAAAVASPEPATEVRTRDALDALARPDATALAAHPPVTATAVPPAAGRRPRTDDSSSTPGGPPHTSVSGAPPSASDADSWPTWAGAPVSSGAATVDSPQAPRWSERTPRHPPDEALRGPRPARRGILVGALLLGVALMAVGVTTFGHGEQPTLTADRPPPAAAARGEPPGSGPAATATRPGRDGDDPAGVDAGSPPNSAVGAPAPTDRKDGVHGTDASSATGAPGRPDGSNGATDPSGATVPTSAETLAPLPPAPARPDAPSPCGPSTRCTTVSLDGTIERGGSRYAIGDPGDEIALGDFGCRGVEAPVVLRPATGDLFAFDSWAANGHDTTALITARTEPGAHLVPTPVDGAGCAPLLVLLPSGVTAAVPLPPPARERHGATVPSTAPTT